MAKEQPVFVLPQAVCDPDTGFLQVPRENEKNPVDVQVGDTVVGFLHNRATGRSRDTIYRVERMTKTLAILKRSDGREVRLKKGKTTITCQLLRLQEAQLVHTQQSKPAHTNKNCPAFKHG